MANNHNQKEVGRLDEDAAVSRFLNKLASLLLRMGIDSPTAERLLRSSFINAALQIAESHGKHPSQSQVAAIAGVSRREVRAQNIAEAKGRKTKAIEARARSRVGRLVRAWRTDRRFCSNSGAPKPLSQRGPKSEFDLLARKYGSDVTKKTLLAQLVMLGLAREENENIVLIRETVPISRKAAISADIKYLASQLGATDVDQGTRRYALKKLSIAAHERKSAEALRRMAITRLDTVLCSLQSLAPAAPRHRRTREGETYKIIVSATVALERGRKPK